MAGLQLSGLASGLDWQNLVDQLIEAERVPQTRLRSEKALGAQKTGAFESLKSNLTALQTSMKGLSSGTDDIFSSRTASIANSASLWSATAAAGTETGSYGVQVTQLATRAQRTGAADRGMGLSQTADVSGLTLATLPIGTAIKAGEFTVNGARITVATTDSLQDVFDQIATKTGGAVTASYDPALDGVRLSSGNGSEIVLGSANDSSNFLTAFQLFNNGTGDVLPPKALGVVSVSSAIANANLRQAVTAVDGNGNSSFTINGVQFSFNANTDTLGSVMGRINASNAGVTIAFDRGNDRFTLSNKTAGDVGIAVSEDTGGLLAALGVDASSALTRGKNALFSVNGGPTLTSPGNTLDETAHGIAGLSVNATSETTETITVGGDSSGAREKIDAFLKAFNAVQSQIEGLTKTSTSSDGKVTAALFASNREVSEIARQLRSKAFDAVPGLSGAVQRLEHLGIDFKSGTSELEIRDSAKLDAALLNNAADVKTLFSSRPDGLAARLDGFLGKVTGATGTIATQTEALAKQSRSLDEQIATMERRLTQQRELLEASFVRMEEAQSNIQRQLAALTNAFGSSSTAR